MPENPIIAKRWIVSMPLELASLCVNCDSVGNQPDSCPSCGSTSILALKPILDRTRSKLKELNEKRLKEEPDA